MGNLPWEVNRRIVTDFLFHKFIVRFRDLFRFRMWKSNTKYKFYTYDDQVFSEFILNYLQRLSPRYIEKGERLFLEQEEVDEIIFVMQGTYAIGFEINKKEKMVIRQGQVGIIGGFECAYGRRSLYIYKALSIIEGYFIRKKGWK